MSPLVHIAMFGWIPVVIGLFSKFKPRRAVIIAFLTAWLFLPIAEFPLPGMPNYTKMSATCWGIFIAAILFDNKTIFSFKPAVIDLPMISWCFCPLMSSLLNGLGLYDGLSSVFRYTVTWGFPYFIGRIYFSELKGLKEFATGILIGGLVYVPLCLFESRMSPQLHYMLYGFHQNTFTQTYRWGGWRPMVFMEHGLMVGVWMASATLISFWLWRSGAVKKIYNIPTHWFAVTLFVTTLMVRSTGAVFLLFLGACILIITDKIKLNILVITLILIPIGYMTTRSTGVWTGYNLQAFIAEHISEDRAESLWYRMENENILAEKAMRRPVFGWGGWGRARVYNEEGDDISVTDGLWIIVFGTSGLFGLAAWSATLLLPIVNFIKHYSAGQWGSAPVAPGAVLAVLLGLYMIDNLLNAMINPIFMVAAGGLAGLKKERQDSPFPVSFHASRPADLAPRCPRFL
jgi:hypothetical protein